MSDEDGAPPRTAPELVLEDASTWSALAVVMMAL
jgi:hypothetical protein